MYCMQRNATSCMREHPGKACMHVSGTSTHTSSNILKSTTFNIYSDLSHPAVQLSMILLLRFCVLLLHSILTFKCMRMFYLSDQYASSSIRYDPLSSCLVDFKGRANMASVKNFQLVHSSSADLDTKKSQEIDAEKDYILQVGKVC